MSRSMVFWDTRCLLTRLACRKSVGQATSRRGAVDASARTFRSAIVFPPPLRESQRIGRRREFLSRFVADQRAVWIGRGPARINKTRGYSANPRSEPTPIYNLFEYRIGAMRSIPIIRWTRPGFCVLAAVHGPGRGQSDPSSNYRARTGRPRQEYGPVLCPVGRTDAL